MYNLKKDIIMAPKNIKEMSFSELNILTADLNKQMEEIRNRMEEAVSEIQNRKKEAINNWELHNAQLKEAAKAVAQDMRILLGMGIDPYSLTSDDIENLNKKVICKEKTLDETPSCISETELPANEITTTYKTFETEQKNKPDRIVNEGEKNTSNDKEEFAHAITYKREDNIKDNKEIRETSKEETSVSESEDDSNHPLLTPYYKLWNLKTINKDKPVIKETIDRKHNPYTGRKMVNKLLTPFHKLFTDKPIKLGLKIGNFKFKKNYPDPEETRIVSVDGYSPTLTYTHSDFWIWIGPKYDENGEIISKTPIGKEIKMAA